MYISVDIEADGPCPGPYSMLSLGAAAFDGDSEEPVSAISLNIEQLPGASQHPDTMLFWSRNEDAYKATRVNTLSPDRAMIALVTWLGTVHKRPVFVGYPASFDSLFVFWYLHNFGHKINPFGWQALDIKTLAMGILGIPFIQSVKQSYPGRWFGNAPHTHVALDDAIEQGVTFTRMLKDVRWSSTSTKR